MQTIMNAQQIEQTVAELAERLWADPTVRQVPAEELALVGIRSRGELLAERLATVIEARQGVKIQVGALDITMYRDDYAHGAVFIPQGTEMNFRVEGKVVVLIDDVLETGRSVRAALDAITDFGRPRMIKLLVLVDRGHREYPIAADFVGRKMEGLELSRKIAVRLTPTDAEDGVFLYG